MRSLNRFGLVAALFAATGFLEAKVFEDVVAKVNGKPIISSEYRKFLRGVLDNYRRNLPEILSDKGTVKEIRQKALEQMIDDDKMIGGVESVVIWDRDFAEDELVATEITFFAQYDEGSLWRVSLQSASS